MLIRNACMMDKEEIYRLVNQTMDASLDKELFETILWENINNTFVFYYVVVEAESILGFFSLTVEKSLCALGNIAKIQEFAIDPNALEESSLDRVLFFIMQKAKFLNCKSLQLPNISSFLELPQSILIKKAWIEVNL